MQRRAPSAYIVLLAALAALAQPNAFSAVLITEIVTDPQQDHGETAGGNGIPFDTIPGTGTVGDTDEFVELFNAGTSPVDLSTFTLVFDDTSDSEFAFSNPGAAILRFSQPGDAITHFTPGAFLVLGNPPGALNNTVTVILHRGGTLEDQIVVDDANATGLGDEAFAREWTGAGFSSQFAQRSVSLLGPGPVTPIPEPATLLLCAAGFAAMLALTRRSRRGCGISPPPAPARATGCPSRSGSSAARR
jgi:hypothetical protein